jgi:hypothetical protein
VKLFGRELLCSLIGVHGRLFNLLEGVATSPVFGTLPVVLGRIVMWSLMKALCLGGPGVQIENIGVFNIS